MSKIKNVDRQRFNMLSEENQRIELAKLTKRANVRIKLLRDEGASTEALKDVERFFKNTGNTKGKFYQGTKKYTSISLRETFEAVSDFLNDEGSTKRGADKSNFKKQIENMIKNNNLDSMNFSRMSKHDRIIINNELGKIANARIKELKENGHVKSHAYSQAKTYLKAIGRKNGKFYQRKTKMSKKELQLDIEHKVWFLNAKTSTVKGIEESDMSRANTFRERGINIPKGFEQDFFDFMDSQAYALMGKYASSNQRAKTYADARSVGYEVEEINQAFKQYRLNEKQTIEQLQEKMGIAPYQNLSEKELKKIQRNFRKTLLK